MNCYNVEGRIKMHYSPSLRRANPDQSFPRRRESRTFNTSLKLLDARLRGHDEWDVIYVKKPEYPVLCTGMNGQPAINIAGKYGLGGMG